MIGSKRPLWLLIVLIGVFGVFVFVARGGRLPFASPPLADVGVSVGVAPNPYNTLAEQLTEKQIMLEEQQADLDARAAALASSTAAEVTARTSPVVWDLGVVVCALAFLVFLNFYLDWRRARNERQGT